MVDGTSLAADLIWRARTARIYARMVRAQVRAQASYRASFLIDLAGNAAFLGAELLTLLVIFSRVRVLGGFTLDQSLLMLGLATTAFRLADLVVGNIERIKLYVRTGLLDTVLIRPLGVLPQLLALDVSLRRMGGLVNAAAILAVAAWRLRIDWTPARWALLLVTPVAGAAFYAGVFVLTSTVAFWWVESGEVANTLTYGGRDFASYPLSIYGGTLRRVVGLGLGFAFVAYYPALALLGRDDPLGGPAWLGWAGPAVSLLACLVAAAGWRFAVRHYRSTGS